MIGELRRKEVGITDVKSGPAVTVIEPRNLYRSGERTCHDITVSGIYAGNPVRMVRAL